MRVLGWILIGFGVLLGIGGAATAMKPSIYPIATIIGAFAIPALLIYAGWVLVQKK